MIFKRKQTENRTYFDQNTSIDAGAPLYSSRIMLNYLEYIKRYYPDIDIDSVLDHAAMTRYEVEDEGHWFSQDQTDRFHEVLVAKTGNPKIAREAGRFTVSSERLGVAKQYALGLITMSSMYMMVGKLANSLTRGSTFKATKKAANKAEILSIPKPGVKEKSYQCQNRIGTLESVAKLFTDDFAEVEHPACFHRGSACCRYIVTWPKTPSLTWTRICKYSLIFSLLSLMLLYWLAPPAATTSAGLGSLFINLILWLHTGRVQKKELIKTVKSQGNAASALLDEMNSRHSNALLIQEVGQTVSGLLDIDQINRAVLKIIKKHTNYDFGSILLASEQKTKLQRAAEFVSRGDAIQFLKNSKYDLTHQDIQGILTECFNTQKPFMVNDVNEIEPGVLEKYSAHLELNDIRSFICVPITYKKESLGLLAVGNLFSKKQLTQSDMSLLMGVASHTATSIINALSFNRIKESEERYRLLATSVMDVIWTIDIDSLKFSYVSPSVERMQGFTPEEILQMPLNKILVPESYEKATEIIAEELMIENAGGADPIRSRTVELQEYCKDGSIIWIEVTASFLRDNQGEVASILGVTRDISERKFAENEREKLLDQLQRAQKMEAIGTLAGGVAHDLNNILSGVISYPELLLMDLPADSPLKKPIETIHESGKKAAAIVEDLLTLARRGVAVSNVVSLNDIIGEYLVSPEFEKLEAFHPLVDIQFDFDNELLNIQGSSLHLSKTIMNLVSNAAEAMPDGGTLSISTASRYIDQPVNGYDEVKEGDYAVLRVSDTGIGISAEEIERIFEPFYTKKVMGRSGTGLGMTVVWGTVKDHKGYIDVESSPGKGTQFTLYFPVTRKKIDKDKANFSINDFMGNGESILVVDDISEQRQIASTILTELGYTVQTVSCGEDAVEYMMDNQADLIVLDMIMDPGIDGLETYKRILKIQPDQKAVIASGYSETDRVKEAQRLGAGDYIKKPYTIEKISTAVRTELTREQVAT
ncbi:MAG: response regulator [Deltaproteobacteria bacterium]|nr:response regulator [Deltaproteobacteria bacterium]